MTLKVKFSHFLTARHYSNSPSLVTSFHYNWFLAKNLSRFVSLLWKLHNRYCHNCTLMSVRLWSWVLTNKVFGQKSTVFEWNYCILWIYLNLEPSEPWNREGEEIAIPPSRFRPKYNQTLFLQKTFYLIVSPTPDFSTLRRHCVVFNCSRNFV